MDQLINPRMPSIRTKCDVKHLPIIDLWDDEPVKDSRIVQCIKFITQPKTAHFFKLFFLLAVALSHVWKAQAFLNIFRAYEQLYNTMKIEGIYMDNSNIPYVMGQLIDLRNNLLMSTATMCILLLSTAYFLIFNENNNKSIKNILIFFVDIFCMGVMLFLLFVRLNISSNLSIYTKSTLNDVDRRTDATEFMNQLVCSIQSRNGLPLCAAVILDSFIIVIVKYLIILAVLTMAYIGLAYLIQYCIRHWFPPMRRNRNAANTAQIQPLVLPPV